MGNEMGNNNTSGFQEENNTAPEATEKSLQEADHIDDVKGENLMIPPAESEECHGNITSSASDDPKVGDTQVGEHKSGEREQETEVHPPSNSHATNGTEKDLPEPLQQDDSSESEPSRMKFEDSASGDVHGDKEQKEAEVDPPPSVSKIVDVPERALQEAVHVDDMKPENHVASPPTESKGYTEQAVSSTPTQVGDDHVDNLVLPERDQEETEVHPPSISNAADTSPKEVVLANDLKAGKDINLPTETKTYLEKGLSLTTDYPKEVRDAQVDNQKAEERGQEVSKLQSPINSNSTDASEQSMQVLLHDDDVKGKNHALPNVLVDENCASSSSEDPKVVGDDPVNELKSGKGEQKETQVHLPTNNNEVDASEKSIQDSLRKDDVEGKDPATSSGENKESDGEATNPASDQSMEGGDPCVYSQTSGQETEANSAESVNIAVKSNGGNAEEKEVQHTLMPKGLEDCNEPNLDDNRPGKRGFQLEQQTSVNTAEEEEITAQEPLKSEALESHEILGDPSIQNGHLLQTDIENHQGSGFAPNSTLVVEEKPVCEEFIGGSEVRNCNGELSTKMNLAKNESPESLPEVKCMLLTEETKLAGKESADEEIKNEHSLAQLGDKFVNESKIKVPNQEINEESKFTLNDCQGDMFQAPLEVSKDSGAAHNDIYTSNAAVTSQSPEIPQDHKQDTVMVSDNDTSSSKAKTLVSAVELAFAKPARELPPLAARTGPSVAESKTSANQANGQYCAKDETSRFSCGSSGAQSVSRSSTESNPESLSTHSQMRKSPSFNLDLLIEARKEETEQSPKLYQDKAATEQSLNPNGSGQDLLQFHAMPTEERVFTLETSDSEKSRGPFLGFLKDEEEANIVITPQGQEDHIACPKKATNKVDVLSSSAKAKGKRKPRPFLFGTCMCCAAVIN